MPRGEDWRSYLRATVGGQQAQPQSTEKQWEQMFHRREQKKQLPAELAWGAKQAGQAFIRGARKEGEHQSYMRDLNTLPPQARQRWLLDEAKLQSVPGLRPEMTAEQMSEAIRMQQQMDKARYIDMLDVEHRGKQLQRVRQQESIPQTPGSPLPRPGPMSPMDRIRLEMEERENERRRRPHSMFGAA